jgi:hypothetical protein
LASSYLRKKRAADRRKAEEEKQKTQKKLEQYVRKKAARAVRDGKNYQPRLTSGKNAEEHSMMVAVAQKTMSELAGKMEKKMVTVAQNITDKSTKKLEKKLDVTDKVAHDAMVVADQAKNQTERVAMESPPLREWPPCAQNTKERLKGSGRARKYWSTNCCIRYKPKYWTTK